MLANPGHLFLLLKHLHIFQVVIICHHLQEVKNKENPPACMCSAQCSGIVFQDLNILLPIPSHEPPVSSVLQLKKQTAHPTPTKYLIIIVFVYNICSYLIITY